eukprot:g29229.t2
MGAVSGGALMKLAARGIPCPPLNLPNKCGGGLAFGLSRTPAFKFFFGYTLLKIVAVPPPLPLPDASILGGVAVSVCLTCPFTKKTGAPVTSGPKIVYTLHHVIGQIACRLPELAEAAILLLNVHQSGFGLLLLAGEEVLVWHTVIWRQNALA